jgi:FkbM family methyltransferase
MKAIEKLKLEYRSARYKYRQDRGGIAYIENRVKKGDTVLDIGAHKGAYLNILLRQTGKQGRVIAFEPQRKLYDYLKTISSILSWENVVVEHLALARTNGTALLNIPINRKSKGTSPGASLVKNFDRDQLKETETVHTETLDSYCLRNNIKPDFLKIDTEGNELAIFKGGETILKRFNPIIYVEIEARHAGEEKVTETIEFLETLGYTGHFIHGLKRIPVSQFSFDKYQNPNDPKNYCNNFTFE